MFLYNGDIKRAQPISNPTMTIPESAISYRSSDSVAPAAVTRPLIGLDEALRVARETLNDATLFDEGMDPTKSRASFDRVFGSVAVSAVAESADDIPYSKEAVVADRQHIAAELGSRATASEVTTELRNDHIEYAAGYSAVAGEVAVTYGDTALVAAVEDALEETSSPEATSEPYLMPA